MKFPSLAAKPDIVTQETSILKYWDEIYVEDLIQSASKGNPKYIFLEGPPTANGHPHMGHMLTRVIKDVYLRYKTMTGHFVTPRIGGWDCHGLPVEIEVEKELGLESKEDIQKYGIEKFIDHCRESVMRYVSEWEEMSKRVGFHLNLNKAYVTMTEEYIESVWWSLKQIYEKGLLFKGAKVIPYCTRCGTPISSHEVAQGYRETQDPSIYIKFKIKGEEKKFFLAWTTTPWTLISNLLLAINENEIYIEIEHNNEVLIFAKSLLNKVFPEGKKTIKEYKGKDLIGIEYESLFSYTREKTKGKRHIVVPANFVSMEDGTGIVHCAPAFGIEDYELCESIGVELFNPVLENGEFVQDVPDFGGMHVKEADPYIMKKLKEEHKLLRVETITHTYPFCWRCDSPLLYYSMESWFIGMSQRRDLIKKLNQQINWKPEHLKNGRFGNFLGELKDWSLSRSRYWGTPLPIWTCNTCNHEFAIGSREELAKLTKENFPSNFSLHKPDVDNIIVQCPKCNKKATREEYVIDCWYDSGSATFAQWHYPIENQDQFKEHFPIDFITEAIDQTRGWFYTLLAISTVIFEKPAFTTCLTMGHIQDEDGKKMSKSKGNVIAPEDIFNRFGADPARWLLFSTPTWNDVRFGFNLVEESMKKFILPLWNVLLFFVTYANLDEYSPKLKKYTVIFSKRPLIDRWIISRYYNTLVEVHKAFNELSIHYATKAFENFLINDLSNLWIRQSRRRFWEKKLTISKKSAYSTLYEILTSMSIALAPFLPFMSEKMYQTLFTSQDYGKVSVHLESFPNAVEKQIDIELETEMDIVRDAIANGRAIRARKDLKVRWPLLQVIFVVNENNRKALHNFKDLILQELNVKEIIFTDDPFKFQEIFFSPNFNILGPKFKKNANNIVEWMKRQKGENAKKIANELTQEGKYQININNEDFLIDKEDFEIKTIERKGYSGASFIAGDLFLNLELNQELIKEGFIRDLIRRIQSMRKDMELAYDDEIKINFTNISNETIEIIREFTPLIKEEVLSSKLDFIQLKEGFKKNWSIQDPYGKTTEITIYIQK